MPVRLTRIGLEYSESNSIPSKQAIISHTERGTIEQIQHPTGNVITPKYNKCGIIVGLEFCDGTKVVRSEEPGSKEFIIFDPQGNAVTDVQIVGLTLDKKGNIICKTGDGGKFTIFADGSTNLL
jgi:hypothetical protein